MIAKLERKRSTAKQSKDLTQTPHKQWEQQQTMNKIQQTLRLRTECSRNHWGLKVILLAKSSLYIILF